MYKSTVAVFTKTGTPISLDAVEIPTLQTGEILVKIEYTTLCRSDLNTYCGKRVEKSPTILGHEIVGHITGFGNGASQTDLRGNALGIGDRISWAIFASNPDSELAKAGIPQKGSSLFKYGHEQITSNSHLHGGLGQHIILRPHTPIVKLRETVPLKIAAIINCAVATVAGAVRQAGNLTGKKVLVSGTGMLGLIACAMSKTMGASRVVALDVNPARLDQAKRFGADDWILAGGDLRQDVADLLGKSNPFHVVFEISGEPKAMEETLPLLGIGGVAVWVGAAFPQRDLHVNAEKIVRNLTTIKGLHNYNKEDFIAAVEFIEEHHTDFPFVDLIHDKFRLDQVNEAFEYALKANPFRVGIRVE